MLAGSILLGLNSEGILVPFGSWMVKHRTLVYADDAVIFIHPDIEDVSVVNSLLDPFGRATGPSTIIAKSSILLITCDHIDMNAIRL